MTIMKSIIRARDKGYLKVSIDICLDGDVPLSSSLIRVDDDAGYLKVSIDICLDGDVPLSSSLIRVDDEVCLNPYEHLGIHIFYNHFTHIFLMVLLGTPSKSKPKDKGPKI